MAQATEKVAIDHLDFSEELPRSSTETEEGKIKLKDEVLQAINIIDGTFVLKWKWKSSTKRHCRAPLSGWKVTALDISTAFLQGLKYGNQGRVIHLKVDAEVAALLRELPGFEDFDLTTTKKFSSYSRVHMDSETLV
eukprot:6490571-Amphidinium_carterae.4